MSGSSIYEKAWINIVFEGKNKEYGAYQLRRENPKTTLKALFIGFSMMASLVALPYFLSSFDTAPTVVETPPNDFDDVIAVEVTPVKPEAPTAKQAAPPVDVEIPNKPSLNTNLTIVEPVKATPNLDPVINTAPTIDPNAGNNTGPLSGDPGPATSGGPIGNSDIPAGPDRVHNMAALDKLPEYPGGMKNFYKYVANNFKAPDAEETTSTMIKVLVSFVVEKDGTLSDIKVLENPGLGMDREAIRVLKSMKAKWEPGLIKGEPVRTIYKLPIAVKPLE
ncbi:energy transducer TonB [Flavobacterium sp.]|uniref:energy transducer TonB n=1 Tax=Flavobacterium sp. TaxID=239 RepID=UPI00262A83FA|nr:energy transducer TonB [Flavobacterium sp.]